MKLHHHALAFVLAVALVPLASAGVVDKAQHAAAQQSWSAWGGDIGVRWNRDLLNNIGVVAKPIEQTTQHDLRRHEWFALRQSGGLQFNVRNGSLEGFTGGSLQMRGGYVLTLRDGTSIDLRNLTLRVRAADPKILDVVSGDGKVWLYSDRLMFELANNNHTLAVRAADVRVTQALADRIGVPESVGWEVADMALNTQVNIEGSNERPEEVCNPYPWPNVLVPGGNGAIYQGDLFMQSFSIDPVGCLNCDGPGGAHDGIAAFAPSSTLINNKNDGTAVATVPGDPLGTSTALHTGFIAWFTMFSGSPPNYNPPYKNDQHPFLIWNLYRINADRSIEQIGRSGTKHAFLTVNGGCLDTCDHFSNHALGRGCSDTYGSGNNDSPQDMGPRSEIVPATAVWGRCGSIWDPSCDGQDHGNNNTSWTQRMQTHESQLDAAVNPGATYKFESWYLAKDDINIYNSMATTSVTPHYASQQWTLSGSSGYRLGPAIDRWVDPTNPPANSMNTELASSEGHVKVAVNATDNGNGTWTYNYAVMNLDYARAVIQGAPANGGPDPRVVSNKGFDRFSIPLPAGATVSSTTFRNGTLDAASKWGVIVDANSVTWSSSALGGVPVVTAPKRPTLDWGTLYSFSITVNKAPASGSSSLHVATAGTPSDFSVATLVPST
jgi:hypothetical protein